MGICVQHCYIAFLKIVLKVTQWHLTAITRKIFEYSSTTHKETNANKV